MRCRDGYLQLLLITFFLVMISVPSLVTVFMPKEDMSLYDQRKLAQLPKIGWSEKELKTFPRYFEAYINDHIGFRHALIRIHNFIKVFMFNKSPSMYILLSKNNWWYVKTEKSLDDYRGLDPFNNKQLQTWKQVLEARNDWLNSQGIRYIFVVAPDKHTIYPEYLPDYIQKVNPQTRLDQLVGYLREHSSFQMVDPRDALLRTKKTRLIYYKTDSHWNTIGGFIAYEELLSRMANWFPGLKPLDRQALIDYQLEDTKGGDFTYGFRLENRIREEENPVWQLKSPNSVKIEFDYNQLSFATVSNGSVLRAVVFRDSFFTAVEGFLSEHFNPVYYVWKRDASNSSYDHHFLKKLIRENKPHVVIEERVERFMQTLPVLSLEEQFDLSNKKLMVSNLNNGFEGIQARQQVALEPGPSGLAIKSLGGDPILVFPEIPFQPQQSLSVRMSITSPHDTNFQFYYLTPSSLGYREEKSKRFQIKKGLNEILIPLPEKGLSGRLRLDPGNTVDDYELHEVEIRAGIFDEAADD